MPQPLGNSGVGKTHLAISLGVEACKQNVKTRFYTFKELIELLTTFTGERNNQ